MPSMFCQTPECERPTEGSTGYCATCNARARKLSREMKKPLKQSRTIDKASPKRKENLTLYAQQARQWIAGKRCACCGDPATDVHHKKGRTNDLLLEKKYWLPVCRPCHNLITEDSAWAIAEGYSISRTKETA